MNSRAFHALMVAAALAAHSGIGVSETGKYPVLLRGVALDVFHCPCPAGTAPRRNPVLFSPGDGGWRGFAIDIAESLAYRGYDMYGIDTHAYLEAFTGKTTLSPSDVREDYQTLAEWIVPRTSGPVTLLGWSEGAGLSLLAASGKNARSAFSGLVTLGLSTENILGWRRRDDITWLTKKNPDEPKFSARDYLPLVAPLPLLMIHSTGDEYTPVGEARELFSLAAEPKKFQVIQAKNHHFDGNVREFFRVLDEGLKWTESVQR